MKLQLQVFCAAAAVLICAVQASADDAVQFRYKMSKDDSLVFRATSVLKQTQKLTVNGVDMTVETAMKTIDVSVRTLGGKDDKGSFKLQSENLSMKIKAKIAQLGEYTFDSKFSDNEKSSTLGMSMTPIYESLSGAIANVTISPLGEVIEVKGLEELLKDALKDNPLGQQFAAGATKDGAKMAYGEFYIQFSEKALKPGDTWEIPFEVKLPKIGTIKGKKIFKYEGPDKVGETKTAKFSAQNELQIDINIDMGQAKVTGSLAVSKSSGTIQFDSERGQVLSSKSTMTMTGDLTVDAGGMTIPVSQTQTQTTIIELLDKLPE